MLRNFFQRLALPIMAAAALLAPRPAAASIPRDTFRPSLDPAQITQPYFTQNAGVAPLTESAQPPEYVLVVVEWEGSLYGIVCRNDPVGNSDPTGLDVNLVYRPFADDSHWLARGTWMYLGVHMGGHVYLEFTDDNMGKDGSAELQEWKNLLASHGLDTTLTSHTFSFHPVSVIRERLEDTGRTEEAKKWSKSGTDLVGKALTLGGGVMWDDTRYDLRPAQLRRTEEGMTVTKRLVTNKREEQLAIYNKVRESWLHEATDYSVELKNCGDWAYRMVSSSGLNVPWGSRLSNVGVGSGGLLDWLGVTRVSYGGVVGYYVSKEAVVAAGGWTVDRTAEAAKWTWEHRDVSVEPVYGRSGVEEDCMFRVGISIPFGGAR